jgi:hypothetical protein
MSKTRFMLATLALGATLALAGPASAEKMKATLNGTSEVPANTSAGTGTADIDYDAATKKLTWKLTYSGLSGPATAAHFHGPADPGKNGGVALAIPNATGHELNLRSRVDKKGANASGVRPFFFACFFACSWPGSNRNQLFLTR